jgi:hypothetical protein
MYLPLVRAGLPQAPRNAGPDGLSFARDAFRALLASGIAPVELRAGAEFADARAHAVAGAIADAARTIAAMPAHYTRYPNSAEPVFRTRTARARRQARFVVDAETLAEFGWLVVPGHVWRAMQRLGTWIEPVLVAEWAGLTRGYAERQGLLLTPGTVEAQLAWVEPTRDVSIAREAVLRRLASGQRLHCV